MQALEFTRALEDILRDLKVNELLGVARPWTAFPGNNNSIPDETKNQFAQLILNSNAAYERLVNRADTRQILAQLKLGTLYEPSRIRALLGSLGNIANSNQVQANAPLFTQFYSFIEQLRSLAMIESTSRELLEKPKLQALPPDEGILELELIEYPDEVGITPKRLEIFVSSITKLHMNLAILLDLKEDTLTFKYFDSGSGVLIGVAAAKGIILALNTLLNQWWDKIRFYRYDNYDKKVEAISKTLEIVDTIQQKVNKGAITLEVGENLKVRMLREVDTLTGIGAMVPLRDATIDQRQILTEIRNTKLLSSGTATETTDGTPGAPQSPGVGSTT
jgi:hypothetical protein